MDTAAISRALTDRLDSLDAELEELTAVPRDPAAAVSFGKRIGDGTTEAIDRMTKVGTAEQLAVIRADVVRALEKIDEGTYGLCDRCGALIPEERLEARQWSVRCVSCAARPEGCGGRMRRRAMRCLTRPVRPSRDRRVAPDRCAPSRTRR